MSCKSRGCIFLVVKERLGRDRNESHRLASNRESSLSYSRGRPWRYVDFSFSIFLQEIEGKDNKREIYSTAVTWSVGVPGNGRILCSIGTPCMPLGIEHHFFIPPFFFLSSDLSFYFIQNKNIVSATRRDKPPINVAWIADSILNLSWIYGTLNENKRQQGIWAFFSSDVRNQWNIPFSEQQFYLFYSLTTSYSTWQHE